VRFHAAEEQGGIWSHRTERRRRAPARQHLIEWQLQVPFRGHAHGLARFRPGGRVQSEAPDEPPLPREISQLDLFALGLRAGYEAPQRIGEFPARLGRSLAVLLAGPRHRDPRIQPD
jgi:hypothetical protein